MSTTVLGSNSYVATPDVNGNLVITTLGGIVNVSAGATGSRPAAGNAGNIYLDTTLFQLEYDNGTLWTNLGVGSVTAGTGIGTTGASGAITISNTGVTSAVATANQTTVSAATGAVTIGIANNPIWPGTASGTLPTGTIAQRPGAPIEGMVRYNSDDDVLEGYCSPYTSTVSQTAFQRTISYRRRRWWVDDFISGLSIVLASEPAYGDLHWILNNSSGTPAIAITTAITDHPGILALGTGGAAANDAYITLGGVPNTGISVANQVEHFAFLIRIPTITTMALRFGLMQDCSTTGGGTTGGTDGVYFQFNPTTSGNLQFFTRSAGTSAAAVNTVTVAANTWYLCEAFYNGTNWLPIVNATAYTAQTTNIPSAAINVGVYINTGAAATRTVQLDYFNMITRELGQRFP